MTTKKTFLSEEFLPKQWYNLNADFPKPMPPPLHPGTGKPPTPEDFAPIFPMNLVEQEMTPARWVDIPAEVREVYRIWRPTPLYRADRLEKALDAPVKIYFKNEGVSPPGSHKPNTAVAQAWYNKAFGVKRLVTETGAGQWGSALAFATKLLGLECKVFMVRVSYDQKPYRRLMMQTWGAECVASPTDTTEAGRKILAKNPDSPGSLGIAISEAIEQAVQRKDTRYSLGSVLNHVMLHQTVIGLEAKKQLEALGDYPDVVIGCAGGGSNFAGASFPFIADKIAGKQIQVIAAEPTSCPTMTRGPYAYDFGDTNQTTPLLPMHTLGHDFVPAPIHAGGLRYHGMAPMVSHAIRLGLIEPVAIDQVETFESGLLFARTEGFIPAPETNHAIAAVIRAAKQAKEEGKQKTIFFNWSGHGLVDLAAYDAYLTGKLKPYSLPDEEIQRALKAIEKLPKIA
ncbi:MAG: TrpB-like pyridoxal phosphate-dependent enzyme [Deltaproteobacteria bacterium]|nr:TrpB-like pyridoxal phosphate-dependent enzyme [Deltaproteobacteria bacterium]